jgi:hypothetical protein
MCFWLLLSLLECGGQGRNRTADASLFRAALYQLSYLAGEISVYQTCLPNTLLGTGAPMPVAPNHTFCNASIRSPVSRSTSACKLLPWASIVTIAAKL